MQWLILYVLSVVIIYFTLKISQSRKIKTYTYTEEKLVDGKYKTVTKIKCPKCGNTKIDYQIVAGSQPCITAKYAVCQECGNKIRAIVKPTKVVDLLMAIFLSIFVLYIVFIIA